MGAISYSFFALLCHLNSWKAIFEGTALIGLIAKLKEYYTQNLILLFNFYGKILKLRSKLKG
jgi:hypothetical protein